MRTVCFRSPIIACDPGNYVNVVVAGKQPAPVWLNMDQAVSTATAGLGVWEWGINDGGCPDLVMACCGDVPTLEVRPRWSCFVNTCRT